MTTTATVPGCPVDESFDPLSPEFLADPYAALARRPGQGSPVFFAPSIGYYVVTSYAAVDAVFRDPATFSAAVAQAPLAPIAPAAQQILLAGGHKPQPSTVSLDEPEHARLRKPAARAFSMKRVTAMVPTIQATTARLLDAVAGQTEFDLVAALAFPLPANIVFSLMGVPEQDYAQVKQWCGYRAALSFGRPAAQDQVEIATTRRRTSPGLRQGPALLPGREPRQAGSPDRRGRTRPALPAAAASAGGGLHLPPQHLVPRPADPERADDRRLARTAGA